MKVRYSTLALAELDSILATIQADDADAAVRFETRIRRVVERIGDFPRSAQEVAGRSGIRRVPLVRYPYVIHYTIVGEEVVILRIIHGARSLWR